MVVCVLDKGYAEHCSFRELAAGPGGQVVPSGQLHTLLAPPVIVDVFLQESPAPLVVNPNTDDPAFEFALGRWLSIFGHNIAEHDLENLLGRVRSAAKLTVDEAKTRWGLQQAARGLPHLPGTQLPADWKPTLFYINLNRRSERRQHMEQQLRNFSDTFHVSRFVAFDGTSYNFSPDDKRHFRERWFSHMVEFDVPSTSNPALMGNILSHYTLWKTLLRTGDPFCFIMQDDVQLFSDFGAELQRVTRTLPNGTFVVWIGLTHHHAPGENQHAWPVEEDYDPDLFSSRDSDLPNTIGRCYDRINPCSTAYVLTREGAEHLVHEVESKGFPCVTDCFMNEVLLRLNKHFISRKVLCTVPTQIFTSDIFPFELAGPCPYKGCKKPVPHQGEPGS